MFTGRGNPVTIPRGLTVAEAARAAECNISAPCGGRGTCGKCRVKLVTGEFAAVGISSRKESLSPLTDTETRFLNRAELDNGLRLACQARLTGDVVLEIIDNAEETTGKPNVITPIQTEIKSAVKIYRLEDIRPDAVNPASSLQHIIQKTLTRRYNLPKLKFNLSALAKLARGAAPNDWHVWVRHGCEVLDLRAQNTLLGAAVDIGTTTIALYLCNLATGAILQTKAALNPQTRHGADVISRISYQLDHPAKLLELQTEVVSAINALMEDTCAAAGYTTDDVADMAVVGNTVMLHLLFGIAPDSIGVRPFMPVFTEIHDIKARDLGIKINQAAYVQCLPSLAGYVGADVIAGVAALEEHFNAHGNVMLLDIGTNGEIVLKNGPNLWSAACATGPALEGAELACGIRAVTGAVEHVKIDPGTFALGVKLIGNESWICPNADRPVNVTGICGSGIIDLISELYQAGLVEAGGRFTKQPVTPRLEFRAEGSRFVLFAADENASGREIYVSQADIRAVQAAKGALYAGCRLLLQKAGLKYADKVLLAGAFGQHINVSSAFNIGLFPALNPVCVEFAGNSAGSGAVLTLLNADISKTALNLAQKIQYVELSEEPEFNAAFTAGMAFPPRR